MTQIKIHEIDKLTDAPLNGLQSYNPNFRNMSLEEIEASMNLEREYLPYGYNCMFFCRPLSTVFIIKCITNPIN